MSTSDTGRPELYSALPKNSGNHQEVALGWRHVCVFLGFVFLIASVIMGWLLGANEVPVLKEVRDFAGVMAMAFVGASMLMIALVKIPKPKRGCHHGE